MLLHLILTLVLSGLFLYLVAALAPGVHCTNLMSAILAALVFSALMGLMRPNLLGASVQWRALITLLVAALGLWLSGLLVPGFSVQGLTGGLAGVLTIGLLQLILLAFL